MAIYHTEIGFLNLSQGIILGGNRGTGMDKNLYVAIESAVARAIEKVGVDALKRTSMFMSNDRKVEEKMAA